MKVYDKETADVKKVTGKYLDKFYSKEYCSNSDKRAFLVFAELPKNKNIDDIKFKINCMHDDGINEIRILPLLSIYVQSLDIDNGLKARDPGVVDMIADTDLFDQKVDLYRFASVYCNYHFPDDYPIFDKRIEPVLTRLLPGAIPFREPAHKGRLNYTSYKTFMNEFKSSFQLQELNYFQLDKFILTCGQNILHELKSRI